MRDFPLRTKVFITVVILAGLSGIIACLIHVPQAPDVRTYVLAIVALAVVLAVVVLLTILTFKPIDRFASWLLVPYALWVGFASILNAAILSLN